MNMIALMAVIIGHELCVLEAPTQYEAESSMCGHIVKSGW